MISKRGPKVAKTAAESAAARAKATANLELGRQVGAPRLATKEGKDARAIAFMTARVAGMSIKEVAATYDCHVQTVNNYLRYAHDHQLVASYARAQILNKLVPMALAVVQTHLEDNDLEAAQDVLYGLGILQKQSNVKHTSDSESDTLESFRAQFMLAKAKTEAIPVEPADDGTDQLGLPLYTEANHPDQPFNEPSQPQPRRNAVVPDQDSEDE